MPLFERADEGRERYIPLLNNELYEVWLPFGLALQMVVYEPILVVVPLLQAFLFIPTFERELACLRSFSSAHRTILRMGSPVINDGFPAGV